MATPTRAPRSGMVLSRTLVQSLFADLHHPPSRAFGDRAGGESHNQARVHLTNTLRCASEPPHGDHKNAGSHGACISGADGKPQEGVSEDRARRRTEGKRESTARPGRPGGPCQAPVASHKTGRGLRATVHCGSRTIPSWTAKCVPLCLPWLCPSGPGRDTPAGLSVCIPIMPSLKTCCFT